MSHTLTFLLGTPALTSTLNERDIKLFDYNEQFSHIIPNGKAVLAEFSRIATEKNISSIEIPTDFSTANQDKIRMGIQNFGMASQLDIPNIAFTPNSEVKESEEGTFLYDAIRATIPSFKQCEATFEAAITQGTQEIIQTFLQHPLVKQSYQLQRNALIAAVKANDAVMINLLLTSSESLLSTHRFFFRAIALEEAAKQGHLQLVKDLLNHDLIKQYFGSLLGALTNAIANGHLALVYELLAIPALKEFVTTNNNAMFRAAAKNGHFHVVCELLKIPAVKAQVTIHNNEALRMAAENGHFHVVRELLKIPAVKAFAIINDNEALRLAAVNRHLDVMRELLAIPEVRDYVTINNNETLRIAAANGHCEMVCELLSIPEVRKYANADKNGALRLAADGGYLEVVRALLVIPQVLTFVADVNALVTTTKYYALKEAAADGRLNVVRELLAVPEIIQNITANKNVVLRTAAANGCLNVVLELLAIPEVRKYANADNNGALRLAAENGHLEVVRQLLKIPAVQAQAAILSNHALGFAAKRGRLEIVRELLKIPQVIENVTNFDNQALRAAAASGHLDVVQELLAIPAVKAQVTAKCNDAFKMAVHNGHHEVVRELLKIPEVNVQIQEALIVAAANDHLEVVRELLTIKEVKDQASSNNNQALQNAAEKGHIDVVCELLRIPAVAEAVGANNNAIFNAAARAGRTLVVQELLKYPQVMQQVTVNQNAALRGAIAEQCFNVINVLLTLKAVRDKLSLEQLGGILAVSFINQAHIELSIDTIVQKHCLSKEKLLAWVSQRNLSPAQVPVIRLYLNYCGYLPIAKDLSASEFIAAAKQSIENSFAEPFADTPTHAGKLLQAMANVAEIKRSQYEMLEGNAESAMDDSLVAEAMTRFTSKIVPTFSEQFTQLGGVAGIEPKLYQLFLERKVAQLKLENTPQAQQALDFIEHNKEALILRDETALAQSRTYFTSGTDTIDIALRALDAGAPARGWDKLFVAPSAEKANNSVFSTRSASETALNLKQTTDKMREMLCYAYCVSQDETLTPEQRTTVEDALIFSLAEISRAKSKDSNDLDNSSCFPGTVTRLDFAFQANPRFEVPKELIKFTQEVASQLIIKAFDNELSVCQTQAEKLQLYQAIILFSDKNAREILHRPHTVLTVDGESADLNKLLLTRKAFFEKYFGPQGEDGIAQINNKLLPHHLVLIDEQKEIGLLALLNLPQACPSTIFSLNEAFERACPVSQDEKMATNPFEVEYAIMAKQFAFLPVQRIQNRYTEYAIKAAYFNMMSGSAEQTEEAYNNAREQVLNTPNEIDINQWEFYELIIQQLAGENDRAQFPTEHSIQDAIQKAQKPSKKRPREESPEAPAKILRFSQPQAPARESQEPMEEVDLNTRKISREGT